MNKKEKLALFLGMLCGDGCLSINYNGKGYRDYPIQFYNTDRKKVILFDNLFLSIFNLKGNVKSRRRKGREVI